MIIMGIFNKFFNKKDKEPTKPAPPPPPPPPEPEPIEIQEVTPATLKARLDKGDDIVVIDMRQPFEYQSGHIPGAVNIFVQELTMRVNEISKDKEVIFQCWHGNSSLQASAYLIENGWQANHVASLSGGIAGWVEANGIDSLVQD